MHNHIGKHNKTEFRKGEGKGKGKGKREGEGFAEVL
jgi:hypothetical protein